MAINKIKKYSLEARCLALFRQGMPTAEIAIELTQELDGVAELSQSAVSRWLKPIRQEEREASHKQITDYLKKNAESDLEIFDEAQALNVQEMRNSDNTGRERSDYSLKVLRFMEVKFRFALSDPATGESSSHPVDLDEFRTFRQDMADIQEACTHG